MGRNKSRVRSRISEPIAPMADEYLSRRILDSLTMKSANMRTRSASLIASASFAANTRKRDTAAAANCSGLCAKRTCWVAGALSLVEPSFGLEPDPHRIWGGGVGRAFGAALAGIGENGGVDAPSMGSSADFKARGVEFLESSCLEDDADNSPARIMTACGLPPPLRGFDLVVRGPEPSVPVTTDMSDVRLPIMASTEARGEDEFRTRLSALRWMMVLSSRTAPARFNRPPEPGDDSWGSGTSLELVATRVSMVSPEGRPLSGRHGSGSSGTQSAGVGGTGPNDVMPLGGGRRVGGEMIGVAVLSTTWTICDLQPGGGGPGGGGGSGMPGSHPDRDGGREREDCGVPIAPVEAARRAAGGTAGSVTKCAEAIRDGSGDGTDGPSLVGSCWSRKPKGRSLSGRLPNDGSPKRRSREPPLLGASGGGRKPGRSWIGVLRAGGDVANGTAYSKAVLTGRGRRVLGGLYGGGGGADAEA